MQIATEDDLSNLKIGTPVLVNIADLVSDIGIFLGYNSTTKKITVLDCFSTSINGKYHANVHDYSRVIILDLSEAFLENLYKVNK